MGGNSVSALVALLGEKNVQLRQRCEAMWNESHSIQVTASEWMVMSRLQEESSSVSEVARCSRTSRQATHKCLRSLEAKGMLGITGDPLNRRCKRVSLTPLGTRCWQDYCAIMLRLEQQIAQSIGADNVMFLKEYLQKNW